MPFFLSLFCVHINYTPLRFSLSTLSMQILKRPVLLANSGSLLFDIFVSTKQNYGAGHEREKIRAKY